MVQTTEVLLSHKLMLLMQQLKANYTIEQCVKDVEEHIAHFEEFIRKKVPDTTILKFVYVLIDQMCQQLVAEGGISCRKGCGHCCHMNVDISPVEAQYILQFVKERNIPLDVSYLQGQSQINSATQGLHPVYSRCVFLQRDNTCGIYEARPLPCRKYFVTSSAARCEITRYPDGQQDVMCDTRMEVIESALYSIYRKYDTMSKMLLQELKNRNDGSVAFPAGQPKDPRDLEKCETHNNSV